MTARDGTGFHDTFSRFGGGLSLLKFEGRKRHSQEDFTILSPGLGGGLSLLKFEGRKRHSQEDFTILSPGLGGGFPYLSLRAEILK